jgi:hypothetical protein
VTALLLDLLPPPRTSSFQLRVLSLWLLLLLLRRCLLLLLLLLRWDGIFRSRYVKAWRKMCLNVWAKRLCE